MSTGITIIGAEYCTYCTKVKHYLDEQRIPYEYIDSQTEEGGQRRKTQSEKHSWKTIPMVFIDGKFVGGCDDFFKGLQNNSISLPKL